VSAESHSPALFKWGIVREVDPEAVAVKVWFEEDELLSWWLPVNQFSTLGILFYVMPKLGAQAAVICDDRAEDGMVVGFRYSQADPGPVSDAALVYLDMGDGTTLQYDTVAHALTAVVNGTVDLTATQTTINGPVKIVGDLDVVGDTSILGGVAVTGAVSADSFAVGETVLAVP